MAEDGEWKVLRQLSPEIRSMMTPGGQQGRRGRQGRRAREQQMEQEQRQQERERRTSSFQPGRPRGRNDEAALGGVVGVVSTSEEETIRIVDGKTKYNEWLFIYAGETRGNRRPGAGGQANPDSAPGPGAPGTPGTPGPGQRPRPKGTGRHSKSTLPFPVRFPPWTLGSTPITSTANLKEVGPISWASYRSWLGWHLRIASSFIASTRPPPESPRCTEHSPPPGLSRDRPNPYPSRGSGARAHRWSEGLPLPIHLPAHFLRTGGREHSRHLVRNAPGSVRWRLLPDFGWLIRRSAQRARYVLTVSEFSRRALLERYELPEDKVVVTLDAVDPKRFRPLESGPDLDDVRRRYHLDRPFILNVGRLEPRKNLERLIRAFHRVLERVDKSLQLIVVGKDDFRFETIHRAAEKQRRHGALPRARAGRQSAGHLQSRQPHDLPFARRRIRYAARGS